MTQSHLYASSAKQFHRAHICAYHGRRCGNMWRDGKEIEVEGRGRERGRGGKSYFNPHQIHFKYYTRMAFGDCMNIVTFPTQKIRVTVSPAK